MKEILHQLVDGLSRYHPMKFTVFHRNPNSYPAWCRISSIHSINEGKSVSGCSPSTDPKDSTFHDARARREREAEVLDRRMARHCFHQKMAKMGRQLGKLE